MGLRISTNMASITAQRTLAKQQTRMEKAQTSIASGSRITKAADDAAGLAISENLRGQIAGIKMARNNAYNAQSLIQVSEGGLNEISNILIRLRELGVQAASDGISDKERSFVNKEVLQLRDEVDRIAMSSRFGSVKLLDGTGGKFAFQVDINNDDFIDRIHFDSS